MSQSAKKTVFLDTYSVCCVYLLAMIYCDDNKVTDIGRNPDTNIENEEH